MQAVFLDVITDSKPARFRLFSLRLRTNNTSDDLIRLLAKFGKQIKFCFQQDDTI